MPHREMCPLHLTHVGAQSTLGAVGSHTTALEEHSGAARLSEKIMSGKKSSKVWDHFERVKDDPKKDGLETLQAKICT